MLTSTPTTVSIIWRYCCSWNTPRLFPPRGLCPGYSLCVECSDPGLLVIYCSTGNQGFSNSPGSSTVRPGLRITELECHLSSKLLKLKYGCNPPEDRSNRPMSSCKSLAEKSSIALYPCRKEPKHFIIKFLIEALSTSPGPSYCLFLTHRPSIFNEPVILSDMKSLKHAIFLHNCGAPPYAFPQKYCYSSYTPPKCFPI